MRTVRLIILTAACAAGAASAQTSQYALQLSFTPDRTAPVALDGLEVSGQIYVFVAPEDGVTRVRFYLDDPGLAGNPIKVENFAPYDFAGTAPGLLGAPYDTTGIPDGAHTITAVIERGGTASTTVHAGITVANAIPELIFEPGVLSITAEADDVMMQTVDLSATDGGTPAYDLLPSEPWLTISPHNQVAPATITLTIDTAGLSTGTHIATLIATADGYAADILMVAVSIGGDYALLVSTLPDRTNPVALDGYTATGDIAVFVSPEADVQRVSFFIDNPQATGLADKVENLGPYDLGGTNADDSAFLWDSAQLSDGVHTITVQIDLINGPTQFRTATFSIDNEVPALGFSPAAATFSLDGGATASTTVTLAASDGGAASFALTEDAPWLTATPQGGTMVGGAQSVVLDVDATGLTPATYSTSITATASGYASAVLPVALTVTTDDYQLWVSQSPNRAAPAPLDGSVQSGDAFIFVLPEAGIRRVRFFLDDPQLVGSPRQTENRPPYDFAGTSQGGTGEPFDTTALSTGSHTVTAAVDLVTGGTVTISSVFDVNTGVAALSFAPQSLTLEANLGDGPVALSADVNASGGGNVAFSAASSESWVNVPGAATTPATLNVTIDPSGLAVGTHTAQITASAPGHLTATLDVVVAIDAGACWPLTCGELKVDLPYVLEFDQDHGKIPDNNGNGTGFTFIDPPSTGSGYIPQLLDLDPGAGVLRITTTPGLAFLASNSLDNALGVGIDTPSQVTVMSTTLSSPPSGTGNFEQGGLWLGNDQDNYVKVVVLSTPDGTVIEFVAEVGGQVTHSTRTGTVDLNGDDIELTLRAVPTTLDISGSYAINGGPIVELGTASVTPEMFSFDAAGIDPSIGTRTFGGVSGSQRNASTPLVYEFERFSVTAEAIPVTPGELAFIRAVIPVVQPTALAWGPDERLYVTELLGTIHAFTLDRDGAVLDDEIITTFTAGGTIPRLTLGVTIDPMSTPTDVILWVSHSSPSLTAGEPNSGMVTRLSGPGFATVEDIITGLPRTVANHAPNSLHFGPDDRLYIAIGGNTGAGAPNVASTEFGTMAEQPLSAAILVADVFAPGFDGSCDNTADIFGPPPCDVVTYATGLRNAYDFAFHPNGAMYATDNGLGVTGTYPPVASAPCTGLADPTPWDQGGDNPGTQDDLLLRITEGAYYGHPNPYRDECVFKDGSYQGVAPLPNFFPPLEVIGEHTSSNGIIAYESAVFCGQLQGELLIANYSVGDDVIRMELSPDGLSVVNRGVLADSFNNPLPLTQNPAGVVFVGEFGGGSVTALIPIPPGCWESRASLPLQTLDAGGGVLDGLLYSVAGKTSAGPMSSVLTYDPQADVWNTAADLPGPGVENPAVVAVNGRLYAFGGSTAPFSGAVGNAAAYDPNTDSWTPLAPMPTPRGGAIAQAVNGIIYVVGGMDGTGASVDTVEAYDPTTDVWSTVSSMATPRDNPGSGVIDGVLYVFGGRTRLADGTEVDGTLDTTEAYDSNTDTWFTRAPMPTGRRTFASGVLHGEIIAAGGEKTPSGGVYSAAEAYDPASNTWRGLTAMPTPRHGVAAGVVDGGLVIAGGGTTGGGSFSNIVERLGFGG